MTIYLTPQTEALARHAIHRREVAATVREAQAIVNRAARAHRANAPRAGEAGYDDAPLWVASRRARIAWAALGIGLIVLVVALGAVTLIRWRNGVTW